MNTYLTTSEQMQKGMFSSCRTMLPWRWWGLLDQPRQQSDRKRTNRQNNRQSLNWVDFLYFSLSFSSLIPLNLHSSSSDAQTNNSASCLKKASKVWEGVLLWHFYITWRRRISSLAWSDLSMGFPLCRHYSSHCAEKTKSLPKRQRKILTDGGSVFAMRQVRQRWRLWVYLSKTWEGTFLNHFTMMPSRQLEIFTTCFQPQSQYLP